MQQAASDAWEHNYAEIKHDFRNGKHEHHYQNSCMVPFKTVSWRSGKILIILEGHGESIFKSVEILAFIALKLRIAQFIL